MKHGEKVTKKKNFAMPQLENPIYLHEWKQAKLLCHFMLPFNSHFIIYFNIKRPAQDFTIYNKRTFFFPVNKVD